MAMVGEYLRGTQPSMGPGRRTRGTNTWGPDRWRPWLWQVLRLRAGTPSPQVRSSRRRPSEGSSESHCPIPPTGGHRLLLTHGIFAPCSGLMEPCGHRKTYKMRTTVAVGQHSGCGHPLGLSKTFHVLFEWQWDLCFGPDVA